MLEEPPDEAVVVERGSENLVNSVIDLNLPVVVDQEDRINSLVAEEVVGVGSGVGLASQDYDPFNLLPIIEAVSRGGLKRRRGDDVVEHVKPIEDGLYRVKKNPRFGRDPAETTYEGSPRSQ